MPINETEFDDIKQRLTRTESSVEQLANSMGQIVQTQQQQQASLGSLSSDMQSILTLLKTRDGRLDIKLLMSVIGGLAAVLVPLGAMFLSPLRTQLDNMQTQITRDLGNTREDVDELRKNGSPTIRERIGISDERAKGIAATVEKLELRERARLEEEASIGRRFLYNVQPPEKKP